MAEIRAAVEREEKKKAIYAQTLQFINDNPRFYIGVPPAAMSVVAILEKVTGVPEKHILLCLEKIRLDKAFIELADKYAVCVSWASEIFLTSIPKIASALQCFILKNNADGILNNLPIAYRHRFRMVNYIIDCFEIEIVKPQNAVDQALTWSSYKHCNTVKYLISSTPDGVVNYISKGYSGRTSDLLLVQECGFLDRIVPGDYILADRGFKHVQTLLLQKGADLLRPPSVESGKKLSGPEIKLTKQVASLRALIERVIRRVREFNLLRTHSVIDSNTLKYLDDCLVIVCALINMQDGLIKIC